MESIEAYNLRRGKEFEKDVREHGRLMVIGSLLMGAGRFLLSYDSHKGQDLEAVGQAVFGETTNALVETLLRLPPVELGSIIGVLGGSFLEKEKIKQQRERG